MRQLGTGQIGADFVCVDNAFLDFVQHFDCLLHLLTISERTGHRVVDHHQCGGSHQHLGASHRNDRCSGCRNAIDLDGDIALVVHKHGINLTCSHTVTAGRIDPHGNVTAAGYQFFLEHPGRYIIVKPTFLCDGAVQFKHPFFGLAFVRQVFPRPELLRLGLHWILFPPFL